LRLFGLAGKLMKTAPSKRMTVALLSVLLAALLPGCLEDEHFAPLKVQLSFSESPALGKTVEVTASFRIEEWYKEDAHDVTAEIILPEGFERVDGDLTWEGDFMHGKTYTVTATVKAIMIGDWEITARALFSPTASSVQGGSTVLYVTVTEDGATVRDRPPKRVPSPKLTSPPSGYPVPSQSPHTPIPGATAPVSGITIPPEQMARGYLEPPTPSPSPSASIGN
jgi:hypothetical protein